VYGRGGYGKSTLLGKLHELVRVYRDGYFRVADVIDCEQFTPGEKATLRQPSSPEAAVTPQIERLDAEWFFDLLREKLHEIAPLLRSPRSGVLKLLRRSVA
jgi:hypothetical protein